MHAYMYMFHIASKLVITVIHYGIIKSPQVHVHCTCMYDKSVITGIKSSPVAIDVIIVDYIVLRDL